MTKLRLVLHQARFDLLGFVRNRQARFFTLVLPILFLVIFVSVFGNDKIGPEHVKASTYYVPGLSALGVIAGSFVNLVISITAQREAHAPHGVEHAAALEVEPHLEPPCLEQAHTASEPRPTSGRSRKRRAERCATRSRGFRASSSA